MITIVHRFLVRDPFKELYYNFEDKVFTAYPKKASLFESYEQAEKALATMEKEGYYKIDKLYKVRNEASL